MANDVKRTNTAPKQWSARLTLLLCLGVLAVLVTQLPDPARVIDTLTGGAPEAVGSLGPLATVESVLLATAGLIAWLLVAWALAVLVLGLAARLPGGGGRRARRLLPRIAPAAVGRLVATAVGVSIIAGTAACAAPADSGSVAAVASGTIDTSTATTTPTATSTATSTSGAGNIDGSISIDWPDPTSPTTTEPITAPTTTEPTTTEPTTTEPTTTAPIPAPPTTTPPTTTPPTTTPPTTTPPTAATTATVATPAPPPTPEPAPPSEPAPPPTAEPTETPAGQTPATETPGSVTVQPGDSLWRIAAHTLGSEATDADIDNAWRAWYFTNHEVIGDDPDVIVPGQALVAPAAGAQVRS